MRIIIQDNERAILTRNGRAVQWLRAGAHRVWALGQNVSVVRFNMDELRCAMTPELERLAPTDELERLVVAQNEVALLSKDGLAALVLGPGHYGVWKTRASVVAKVVNASDLVFELPDAYWEIAPAHLLTKVVVQRFQTALVYVNGVLERTLGAGRYALSAQGRQIQVLMSDTREKELQIVGQELMTRDKVTLRLTLMAKYRVVDPVLAHEQVEVLRDALYAEIQLAARAFVASLTIEALLERQNEAVSQMAKAVAERAGAWGVEIQRVDVKDIVLPGEMRSIMNRVIEAQKEAEANTILRREETAATRALANTAKMLEANPTLMRLKELEAIKDIAGRVDHLTVVAGKGADFLVRGE